MIADALLRFCKGSSLATAIDSDVIDLKQEYPNTGSLVPRFYVVLVNSGQGGEGTVTLKIQDSADGSEFADVLSLTVAGNAMHEKMAIPMPLVHRRYVKLKTVVSGVVTGKTTAYLHNEYDLPRLSKNIGEDIVKSID